MRVFIEPFFSGEDAGDGGIRRVVEAQRKGLPSCGIEVVDSLDAADLIASHIYAQSQTARHLNTHPEVPLVLHCHGLYWSEYEWPNWAHKANDMIMEALRAADEITAPSEWVAQALRRNSLRPISVIGHGINLQEWTVPPRRGTGKGYVLWNKTRIDSVCSPVDMNELARRAPDVPFVTTFGDADLSNVGVTGALSYKQAKKAVREASLYLCTARETFGIGTLEAMAAGVPVLGWRWGGQVDIVEHGVSGWLSTPGDYVDLLQGLRYCLDNLEEMGAAAAKQVKAQYRWQDVIPQYAELYTQVLARRREERPRVSVVVPAYNMDKLLPRALDSVAVQEGDWECVIVDDASTDKTSQVAEKYASIGPRWRVIHNANNQYLAGALNIGIAAARGRYIVPLDADNELAAGTLETLAGVLDYDRSIHIAYGNVEFVEPDGRRWHSGWPMHFRPDWQLIRRNMVPSTAMFRREVWEATGGYRRRYRTAEDADFWTRATSYGFVAKMVTDADTLIYHNREDSMSRTEEQKDWTVWYPWARNLAQPPAAMVVEGHNFVPSCDPPLIAVIIPVGPGHEELYVDALDSVDGQVFRHFEAIVINDTGAPLRWVPSWARLIETKGRVGVAASRNAGISLSRARLFIPLDADDTLEPYALDYLYRVQQQYGGYVYSDWYEMWEKEVSTWRAQEYNAQDLISLGSMHAVTALYRKTDWEALGGFDEELSAWEDWDFQLKLANAGTCGTRVPVPLFTYRKETGMRRDANYANFEQSKEAILSKWGEYFNGGKKLMGCQSCPGGGGAQVPSTLFQQETYNPPPSDDPTDYVVVDYMGDRQGSTIYRAPSGQAYRFSADAHEKQKYVRREDADFFAGRKDFRVRKPEASPTEAVVAG